MYHDEFAKVPVNPTSWWGDLLPDLVMQIGGGLTLALMASLNRPASMALFIIGGCLPIVAFCLYETVNQALGSFNSLALGGGPNPTSATPTPLLQTNHRPMAVGRLRMSRAEARR